MAAVIYTLCVLTCLLCAILLLRSWQQTRVQLLFWSALCFAGLTASNVLLVLDHLVFLEADLTTPRLATALAGLLLLVFGLVWEKE